MRVVLRNRYYCDHCKKGAGTRQSMARHEAGCTLNPQRECRMCLMKDDERIDELSLVATFALHSIPFGGPRFFHNIFSSIALN